MPSIGCLLRAPRRGSSPQPGMSPGSAGGLSSRITPALDTLPGPAAGPQEASGVNVRVRGHGLHMGPRQSWRPRSQAQVPPACPPCGTGLLTRVPPGPWVPALQVGSPETPLGAVSRRSHGGGGDSGCGLLSGPSSLCRRAPPLRGDRLGRRSPRWPQGTGANVTPSRSRPSAWRRAVGLGSGPPSSLSALTWALGP